MRCNHAACNTEQGPCHPTEHVARHAQYQRSHLRPCTHLCPQNRHQKLLHTKEFVQLVFWHQQYYPNVMCARCPLFNNKVHLTQKPGHRVFTAPCCTYNPTPHAGGRYANGVRICKFLLHSNYSPVYNKNTAIGACGLPAASTTLEKLQAAATTTTNIAHVPRALHITTGIICRS